MRVEEQGAVVCGEGVRSGVFFRFTVQGDGEPFIGSALGHDPHAFIEFTNFKIQNKLTGERLETSGATLHDDVAAIGEDAQFGERRLGLGKLFVQGGEGAAQAAGWDPFFDELFYGAQADQVAEVVGAVA